MHATKVTVTGPDAGTVEIAAWDGGRLLTSRRFAATRDEYRCRDHGIEISSKELVGQGQGAGVEWNTIQLGKATDGSLVLKHTNSGVGLIIVFPAGGSESRWYRFKSREE